MRTLWFTASAALVMNVLGPALASAQYDDLPPGVWREVSLNTIEDVQPCPDRDCPYSGNLGVAGVTGAWTGGAFATGVGSLGALVAWGGGHNAYWGSEVYVFDLALQRWRRASDPYDGPVSNCGSEGTYPDGSPCADHTYDRVQYLPETNQLIVIGGTTDPPSGGGDEGRPHLFDFDTGSWSIGPELAEYMSGIGATSAYDSGRGTIWFMQSYLGADYLRQYDPRGGGTWTRHAGLTSGPGIDGAAIHDPVRDLFLYVTPRADMGLHAFDLSNPENPSVELTTAGDTSILGQDKLGFEWDPSSGRGVAWAGGADVYVLEPPDGDWRTGTWTWIRVPPDPSNSVVPTESDNGTYSRFRYAPSVNVFVLVSHTDGPVWAYRLTDDPGMGPRPDAGPPPDAGGPSDAGASPPDGGGLAPNDSGSSGGADGGVAEDAGGGAPGGGCSCRATGPNDPSPFGFAVFVVLGIGALGRRRMVA